MSEFLYVSADDIYIADTTLYDLTDEFSILGGKVIVFDEIHKYKNWAQELKNIYDSFPEMMIRFSGSSMLNILYEKYDLSRRCVTIHMETLSFHEFLGLSENKILAQYSVDEIIKNGHKSVLILHFPIPKLYSSFLEYLKYGAYPFFIEDRDEFKPSCLTRYRKSSMRISLPAIRWNMVMFPCLKDLLQSLLNSECPIR